MNLVRLKLVGSPIMPQVLGKSRPRSWEKLPRIRGAVTFAAADYRAIPGRPSRIFCEKSGEFRCSYPILVM